MFSVVVDLALNSCKSKKMEETQSGLEQKSAVMPTNFKVFLSVGKNCPTGDGEPVIRGKLIFFRLAWPICHKNRRRNEILTAIFRPEASTILTFFVLVL